MKVKKRVRSANFEPAEIKLLLILAEKYKHYVENKNTDTIANKNKFTAWKKIAHAFNSSGISNNLRSVKTLKSKYEVVKKNSKEMNALLIDRPEMQPSKSHEMCELEEKAKKVASSIKDHEESLSGDNLSDLNDMVMNIKEEASAIPIEYSPPRRKRKFSNEETTEKATKTSVASKLHDLSTAKMELLQLKVEAALSQQVFIEEEHKMKMLQLEKDEERRQQIHELLVQRINGIKHEKNGVIN